MKRRNRKLLGYFFLILGLALPLYALTNLSLNAFLSRSRYMAFRRELEARSQVETARREAEFEAYNARLQEAEVRTAVDPFTLGGYRGHYDMATIGQDEVIAYVIIPKIDLIKPMYLDASREHLAKGLAHLEGTHLPLGGVNTRSVIAGHRGWYKDALFLHVDELAPGDVIYVDRGEEVLTYAVTDTEVIHESDWDSLQVRPDKDVLTLLTCYQIVQHPSHRLIVNAERVMGEAGDGGGEVGVGGAGADAAVGANVQVQAIDLKDVLEETTVSTRVVAVEVLTYAATLLGYVAMVVILWHLIRFLREEATQV